MANLTQLKLLEELDAFLLVDKPAGISFSTVVKTIKRKFNLVKVGHGGSLDAAASGLMVVLVNDANKYANDIMNADRDYVGTMCLGLSTDTCDIQGREIARAEPSLAKLDGALKELRGDVFLAEPRYCAVRREGSSAYEIADTGEHEMRLVHLWDFAVSPDAQDPARCSFKVSATKGLILRALAGEFGALLGCGAALETSRRTRVGKFRVEDAVPFQKLLEIEMGDFAACTMSLAEALR